MDNRTCETCGNYYERAFIVQLPDGGRHVFDSFECAIARLAPVCTHCGCRVIGHGVESDGEIYCCSSCVRMSHKDLHDGAARDDDRVSLQVAESFPASDPPSYS